jgi:hypothetical protein
VVLKWGARLGTVLALLVVIAGLVVLALPDPMEGGVLVSLDAMHCVREADLLGAGMVAAGAVLVWLIVLIWQRKRIQ